MKTFSGFSFFLPLALFLGALVLDMNIMSGLLREMQTIYLREGFVLLALILSLPIVYKQKWASDRNVLRGLRSLFFLILFTYFVLVISDLDIFNMEVAMPDARSLYNNIATYIFTLAWTIFSCIFVLVVLGTLRNLIFIKQKKHTAKNFNIFMIFLVIYTGTSFAYIEDFGLRFSYGFGDNFIGSFVLFVLINLMVINSLRVSWINYLNRKQKLACFWGGIILVTLQILLNLKFHAMNPATIFSPVLGKFADLGFLFLSVYLCVAFVALVFHLPTAHLYDRKIKQISSLHHLSRAVSTEFDLKKLVLVIVQLAADVTESEFCWLELVNSDNRKLNLVSSLNLTGHEKQLRSEDAHTDIYNWILNHKETILVNDVHKDSQTRSVTVWKRNLGSLLVVPLIGIDKILGLLFLGKRIEYGYEQDDIDTLRAFSEQVVIAIENARLIEASLVKERLEQELRIAHDTQMKLLPKVMPRLKNIGIDAICITANEVGGDYYDFFRLDENRTGLVVGDVSGKGSSAAFYMAEVKGIIEALAKNQTSPKKMLVQANEILYDNIERNVFISAIYGIIDNAERRFTFCRAGHCPILLAEKESDELKVLEPYGMGLGLVRGDLFQETLEEVSIELKKDQTLLFYTDGATESRNEKGEEIGETRLMEYFFKFKNLGAKEIKSKLIHEIKSFIGTTRSHDDLTFIVIKVE